MAVCIPLGSAMRLTGGPSSETREDLMVQSVPERSTLGRAHHLFLNS